MKINEKIKWRALGRMLMLLMAGCVYAACGGNDPVPPTLELNPTSINFTKNASDQHQLTIKTSDDASWKIYDSECSDWLSISTKEGKGTMTVTLTTKNENKKGAISVNLEVVATNEAGQVSKTVAITRDPIPGYDAYARQTEANLIMSYGMACAVESSNATSYFKYNVYTADAFRNYEGNDDAIAQEATKSSWTRENIPSDGRGVEIVYNNCQPATDYVFVTVAYDREGNRGEINTYPFATKDAKEDNQPRVSVEPQKKTVEEVHDENNGPWYKWDTNVDGKFYITYACASDKLVETMQPHNNEFGIVNDKIGLLLAWNIFMESKNDNLDKAREVTFNKNNSSGREKLFGKAFNNKTQWIEYRNTDKYLQIVTWAFKGEDFSNPSGVVSDVLYHVDNGVLREVEAPIEYYVKVAPTTLSFGAVPSNGELTIDSNDSWTITSNQDWCKIDGEQTKKGSGIQKVTVTVTQNESTSEARTAQITLTGDNSSVPITVAVTQDPKGIIIFGKDDYDADKDLDGGQSPTTYTLSVSPKSMAFVPAGEQKTLSLTGNDSWTASPNLSWCTLSKSNGTGDATITITANKNTTTAQRTATVTITGSHTGAKTVSVTQEAYTLSVTPTSLTMENTADSKTVTVSSNGQWTASSNQTWCTLSNSSGSNNGTITIKVSANTIANERTATITIKETNTNRTVAVTVTQCAGISVGRDEYDPDKNL